MVDSNFYFLGSYTILVFVVVIELNDLVKLNN